MDMLRQGNVDKITVKQLIDACHVSRQTFYYYFQDLLDIMEWSIRQQTEQLLAKSLKMKDMCSALQVLIAFTVEQYPLLHKLMHSQRRAQFEDFLTDSLQNYILGLVQFHHRELPVSYADKEAFLQYNACGLAGMLLRSCGKPDLDQKQLAQQVERMLLGELSVTAPQ